MVNLIFLIFLQIKIIYNDLNTRYIYDVPYTIPIIQESFIYLYGYKHLRNSSDFILPEDCCLQTVKCRDSDLDTDLCKVNKTRCIVSKINKTFIQNYIIKMKKSNYNIKEVSVQCSGNYLNLFFPLIFFLFYFVYL